MVKKIEHKAPHFLRRLFILCALVLVVCPTVSFASDAIFKTASDLIAAGDFNTAIRILSEVNRPDGNEDGADFVKSRTTMAQLFAAMEEPEKGLAACEQVLALFPDNIEAQNMKASLAASLAPAHVRFFKDCVRFFPALLKGAGLTLLLVFFTMGISPVGGLLIALGRISTFWPLSSLCWLIIWMFRGTPLLLQLFFIYYGLPALGITLSPLAAAFIGLGLNYSAYLAEIIRAGILSIDDGQMEAAKALGMGYTAAMRRIIIPQTYKRLVPPIGNEFIALIKDTALVSTIAMVELMRSADQLFNTYFNVNVLILAACMYLLMTTIFTLTFETIERKVGAYENR